MISTEACGKSAETLEPVYSYSNLKPTSAVMLSLSGAQSKSYTNSHRKFKALSLKAFTMKRLERRRSWTKLLK